MLRTSISRMLRPASPLLAIGLAFAAFTPARLHAQSPQIALTFDDLPAHGPLPPGEARPAVVKSILATLKTEKLPPTYGFVNGFRLAAWPYQVEILRAWQSAGQPLGNHTWSHPELDKLTVKQYTANISQNEATLQRVDAAGDWHWFRYPFLEEGDTVEKREGVRAWLMEHHYRLAEISMDFQDYNWNDSYARCAAQHNEAAIRTLHDTYLEAAAKAAAAFRTLSHTLYARDIPYILLLHVGAFDGRMLAELIAQYRAEGFEFVSLPDASQDDAYAFDPKVKTPGGATFLEQVATARNVIPPLLPDYSVQLAEICKTHR